MAYDQSTKVSPRKQMAMGKKKITYSKGGSVGVKESTGKSVKIPAMAKSGKSGKMGKSGC